MGHIDLANLHTLGNINIIHTETADLIGDRKNNSITERERVSIVTNFVKQKVLPHVTHRDTEILIEKQIAGTHTYIVFISLLTLLVDRNITVKIISGTHKNTLTIGDKKIGTYYQRYPGNTYIANKQHSLDMFRYSMKFFGNSEAITFIKHHEKDLADAFNQLLYHLSTPLFHPIPPMEAT